MRATNFGVLNNEYVTTNSLQENYEAMLNDHDRNQLIVDDICHNFKRGRHQLVLTKRLAHLDILAALIPDKLQIPVFELSGRLKPRQNQATIDKLVSFKQPYVLLATGNYIGEGFDVNTIDTLLLAMPISWKGNVEQYIGRLNRDLGKKSELQVFDYADLFVPMLAKMYKKQLRTYHTLHYQMVATEHQPVFQVMQGKTGRQKLMSELRTNQPKILIGVSQLNSAILRLITRFKSANIIVVTLPVAQQVKHALFDKLKNLGVTIKYNNQVLNTIIIDDKIVWYDYHQVLYATGDNASLRFSSTVLAERFSELFLQVPPLLDDGK